ncbi:acyl carrier protein [Streptomyces violaceorubidus]|uniref:Acyl carrier protein n=1 Tax=Streptomyces violaceorubidus TaxID=284042 RepID=A0ABV1T5N0_9ACTN
MTPFEMMRLMARTLDISHMETDDSFFEFGGNSLLAWQMIVELEERYGVRISLLDLVRSPTPDQLAAFVADRGTLDSTANR